MYMSREIIKAFKSKGLTVTSEACQTLSRVLQEEPDPEGSLNLILSEIRERIEKREIKSSLIGIDVITNVVAEITSSDEDLANEKFQLLDAFSSPKIEYDENQKQYKLNPHPSYTLYGDINSKANMYRQRLQLTLQRLLRSSTFVLSSLSKRSLPSDVHEISTVTSLLGSTQPKILFGMLTQPEEGCWFLEDLTGIIKLDFSRCHNVSKLYYYTETCQVIVQGLMMHNVFVVDVIGQPPPEDRVTTLSSYGIDDIFGNGTTSKQLDHMTVLENQSIETMIVVISDLQIDKPVVQEKLQLLFEGFESLQSHNMMFILMGNFMSKSVYIQNGRDMMKNTMKILLSMITKYPFLCEYARFLIVPGNNDPGICTHILPRKPISDYFLPIEYVSKIKYITCASNPCRLRYYTQEIVLYREDLLKKFQRHSLFNTQNNMTSKNTISTDIMNTSSFISQSEKGDTGGESSETVGADKPGTGTGTDIAGMVAHTIIHQSHLCPLSPVLKPVYWELDYTLRLSPLPHVIFLGDKAEQSVHEVCDCKIVYPGSFSTDYSFVLYRPAIGKIELSRIQ